MKPLLTRLLYAIEKINRKEFIVVVIGGGARVLLFVNKLGHHYAATLLT